jgi:hypothetical protein
MGRARSTATDSFTAVFGNTRGVSAHLLPPDPSPKPPDLHFNTGVRPVREWRLRFLQYIDGEIMVELMRLGSDDLARRVFDADDLLDDLEKEGGWNMFMPNGEPSLLLDDEHVRAVCEYLRALIAHYRH